MSVPEENLEESLFQAALEKESPGERAAFLDEACGDNRPLRQRLEVLLEGCFQAGGFLPDQPALIPVNEKPGDRIGRYKLREQIGEGGCGVVYVAEQEEPVRRKVALKVIKLGMDTRNVVARFEAERQALAMMDHPNIARVFDAGATETGRPYFVMELVRGIKITDYCDQNRLSTPDRLELFIKVCQAVQHAHQKGIIHRDLKPSNILVTINDGVAVPKVIDFGIAKATEGRLTDLTVYTDLHQFIGTPAYMSPEQATMTSLDLDTRSDIYSLGVLLYELLTGRTPFDTQELMALGVDALRRTLLEREPARPSTRLSTLLAGELTTTARNRASAPPRLIHLLRGDLDWIVMKCLEKDRARRYETANGLAADVKSHLANEPVVARPPSVAYKFQKAFRRNKLLFSAGSAVVLALLLGLAGTTWQWRSAASEGQRANIKAREASDSREKSRRLLYDADLNLAQQALNHNNVGEARRLLDRHRPQPGEEDLRGWEWRYLWQLTRGGALVNLTNRPTRGFSVSFSPDGARLAVGWFDGRVDLWDVPGRRLVRALTARDYPEDHAQVAFSPVRNLLATSSEPGVITLYDLDSGRESIFWRTPDPATGIRDLSFSPDGSRLVIFAGVVQSQVAEVFVVNGASARIEFHHSLTCAASLHHGAARISPDNRRLYLGGGDYSSNRYGIECLDLATGEKLWETKPQRDMGLTALAVSPDGQFLASGSGFEDSAIRIWEAATGRMLFRLDGHAAWVCKLAFTPDGRSLLSAATDQSIRFWDTSTWTESETLLGHSDEVHALAVSGPARLIASTGKDGNLLLWNAGAPAAVKGYYRPSEFREDEQMPLEGSRMLWLRAGQPPRLWDLKSDAAPAAIAGMGDSTNFLGCFDHRIFCHWDGTSQIVVRELRGTNFAPLGAITLNAAARPTGFCFNAARQIAGWTEAAFPNSVFLESLASAGRRRELKSDIPGLRAGAFSVDGVYIGAESAAWGFARLWNVATGRIVVSNGEHADAADIAAGGRVFIVTVKQGNNHEVRFYDLTHPERPPRRVPGREYSGALAVSPDGGLVASSTDEGLVRLFDPAKGELITTLRGHLHAVNGLAFSADGTRLVSASSGGREVVKLWDVGTRQELLTLSGPGPNMVSVRWSPDQNTILAGVPWQAWRAPSWEEIARAEAEQRQSNSP